MQLYLEVRSSFGGAQPLLAETGSGRQIQAPPENERPLSRLILPPIFNGELSVKIQQLTRPRFT